MGIQDIVDEEQLLQSFIDTLLDKEEEEKLEIEMRGHPATWLDDPMEVRAARKAPIILEGNNCSFEIIRMRNGNVKTTSYTNGPVYMLDFKTKKVYLSCKKLQLLLDHHDGNGYTRTYNGTDAIFIPVPVKTILRYADKID